MSKSGKHGAVWSDQQKRYVNSPTFTKRYQASRRKAKAARRARRKGRA